MNALKNRLCLAFYEEFMIAGNLINNKMIQAFDSTAKIIIFVTELT